jgi:transcriptional regulator with XRE-family HTH domain
VKSTKRRRAKRKPKRAIHARIAELRVARGMTQVQLANALGLDKTAVNHWERGVSAPTGSRIPEVAALLGVSIDELFREAA